MDEYDTPEVETDIETTEEGEGSYLTTAAVFGVGALAGALAVRSYGKVKATVLTRLADRRDGKTQEIAPPTIEANATEAE